jgi:scyllo-inositol 2-dehydrogenase (NADP+)
MRVVVVGLGNQGRKRQAVAGSSVVATVDPVVAKATYRSLEEAPVDAYDAALVCTSDQAKPKIIRFLLERGKHVLVEKPLLGPERELREFAELCLRRTAVCYTAYNHRFEPHVVALKKLLEGGTLGTIYRARLFYGNGTALDVRNSVWRDQGMGVLSDLGSHLLDLVLFLFGKPREPLKLWSAHSFENRALDHIAFGAEGQPAWQLEMTLLSWRNTFSADVFAERGTAHIDCLCKWGPSTFTVRRRILPSGKPTEERHTLECPDPTWVAEYAHFEKLCATGGTNIENDIWIQSALGQVYEACRPAGRA